VGARVAVRSLMVYEKRSAEDYLNEWKNDLRAHGIQLPEGDRTLVAHDYLSRDRKNESPLAVRTDKEGKFEITGVGTERLAGLTITGNGIADTRIGVMNRARFDPKPFNEDPDDRERMRFSFMKMSRPLFGPEPVVIVEQEKIIRGRVTDQLGRPRSGVRVVFSRPNRRDLNPDYNTAFTDSDGKYVIHGARKHKGYMVECPPDPKAGLLQCQAFAEDTVGYEPITLDLKCAQGVVVTGTIKDKVTGAPIISVFTVVVLAKNPFVKDYPPFTRSAYGNFEEHFTDKNGRFRLVTIPGPVLLMARPTKSEFRQAYKPVKADPKYPDYFHTRIGFALGYYGLDNSYGIVQGSWCKVIDAKKGDTKIQVNVELEPATSMTVRVVDAAGKPVKGVHATGITHVNYETAHPFADSDVLTLYNVEPGHERFVAAVQPKRKLVGTRRVKASDKDPVVKLGPGGVLSGRVVDADGKPIAGVTVDLHYTRREVSEAAQALVAGKGRSSTSQPQQMVTGPGGDFRFDTLFPSCEFRLTFQKGSKRLGPDYQKAPKHTIAKHGDELKLADVVVTPAEDQ
jgi:hypothetical protein